jgi:hypothetical protein
MNRDLAETVALQALAFIAEDPDALGRLLAASGLGPADLRHRTRDPELLAGVLDHLLGDEALLLAFTGRLAMDPALPLRARAGLPGGSRGDPE